MHGGKFFLRFLYFLWLTNKHKLDLQMQDNAYKSFNLGSEYFRIPISLLNLHMKTLKFKIHFKKNPLVSRVTNSHDI